MSYDETDVQRLGQTLAAAEMTSGERRALHALIGFAAPPALSPEPPADLSASDALTAALHHALFEPASS